MRYLLVYTFLHDDLIRLHLKKGGGSELVKLSFYIFKSLHERFGISYTIS